MPNADSLKIHGMCAMASTTIGSFCDSAAGKWCEDSRRGAAREPKLRLASGPPPPLRGYGATAFAWLAEPKLTLRVSTRERRMVDLTGIEPVTS